MLQKFKVVIECNHKYKRFGSRRKAVFLGTATRLDRKTYQQDAVLLGPQLLGKLLCRRINGEIIKNRVTETESYCGVEDTACHAHKGRSKRTEAMYLEGGHVYVYLCYGRHFMLNIVAGPKDSPEAVLIRGIVGYNGPGKLTKAMEIDHRLNGETLLTSNELWLEDDGYQCKYTSLKRIGIGYAIKEDRNKLWRFCMASMASND
ncbi:MAG: DNA-3-methyladenine glycosylase [Oscillospiraceae bacterium]|jgi:DNA-3-methyladenine glycosylase|nr:DNA-3-methyladenine glycosylase [Oscillospiraceae bacterium]